MIATAATNGAVILWNVAGANIQRQGLHFLLFNVPLHSTTLCVCVCVCVIGRSLVVRVLHHFYSPLPPLIYSQYHLMCVDAVSLFWEIDISMFSC